MDNRPTAYGHRWEFESGTVISYKPLKGGNVNVMITETIDGKRHNREGCPNTGIDMPEYEFWALLQQEIANGELLVHPSKMMEACSEAAEVLNSIYMPMVSGTSDEPVKLPEDKVKEVLEKIDQFLLTIGRSRSAARAPAVVHAPAPAPATKPVPGENTEEVLDRLQDEAWEKLFSQMRG